MSPSLRSLALLLATLPLADAAEPDSVEVVLRAADAPLVLFEQRGRLYHLMEQGSWASAAVRRVALAEADFPERRLVSRFRRGDGSPPEPLSWSWSGGTTVVAFDAAVFRAELEERTEHGYERDLAAIYPVRRPDPPRHPRRAGEPPSFDQCTPPGRVRSFLFVCGDSQEARKRSMVVPVPRARTPDDERRFLGARGAGNVVDGWTGSLLSGSAAADVDARTFFAPAPLTEEALALFAGRVPAEELTRLRAARFVGWRFDPAGEGLALMADGLELRLTLGE